MMERIKQLILRIIKFLTHDIWRFNKQTVSSSQLLGYRTIQVIWSVVSKIISQHITSKSSALTYSTLLSIVPILALLFALSRGFGLQQLVEQELYRIFEGQQEALTQALSFVDKSLEYAQEGIFVGVGVLLLFYTVINLIMGVEVQFNLIWNVKEDRSFFRMFTDYLALIVVVPLFLLCSSGINIFLSSSLSDVWSGYLLLPLMKVISFSIMVLLFCFVYMYIPNTKVRFFPAFIGALFAGTTFLLFQTLYISGQIWISKYNAIYGSFAALPLLLLWLNISWLICLTGMLLTETIQHVDRLNLQDEVKDLSRRMSDFFMLLVATRITQRFAQEKPLYTIDELSTENNIPIMVVENVVNKLCEINILLRIPTGDKENFIPAFDIEKFTVSELMRRANESGCEDFGLGFKRTQHTLWDIVEQFYDDAYEKKMSLCLKDITLGKTAVKS